MTDWGHPGDNCQRLRPTRGDTQRAFPQLEPPMWVFRRWSDGPLTSLTRKRSLVQSQYRHQTTCENSALAPHSRLGDYRPRRWLTLKRCVLGDPRHCNRCSRTRRPIRQPEWPSAAAIAKPRRVGPLPHRCNRQPRAASRTPSRSPAPTAPGCCACTRPAAASRSTGTPASPSRPVTAGASTPGPWTWAACGPRPRRTAASSSLGPPPFSHVAQG